MSSGRMGTEIREYDDGRIYFKFKRPHVANWDLFMTVTDNGDNWVINFQNIPDDLLSMLNADIHFWIPYLNGVKTSKTIQNEPFKMYKNLLGHGNPGITKKNLYDLFERLITETIKLWEDKDKDADKRRVLRSELFAILNDPDWNLHTKVDLIEVYVMNNFN